MTPMAMDQNPPRLDLPQEAPFQIQNLDGSFPASVPPDSAAPPLLGPPFMSNPETSPQQLTEVAPQPQLRNEASDLPLSPNQAGQTAALDPPGAQGQQQTQTRSPGSAPHSPPGSSAVWKKNQGTLLLTLKPTAVTYQMYTLTSTVYEKIIQGAKVLLTQVVHSCSPLCSSCVRMQLDFTEFHF